MPDIHIHRDHRLGLDHARRVAKLWAADAEQRLDMACTYTEGDTQDTLAFTRIGVRGELLVEAHQFTFNATLGFLLGAFSKTIEAEIEKNFDDLLSGAAPARRAQADAKRAARPAATRGAAKR